MRRFGKHSFRSTGAVHLSEMGLEVAKIQLLGRWMCMVVLRYCRDAPLKTTAQEYKRGRSSSSAASASGSCELKNKHVKAIVDKVSAECEEKMAELRSLILQVEAKGRPREYVANRKTGKIHRVLTYFTETGVDALAWCGFKYGRAQVKLTADIDNSTPWRNICSSCLTDVRARLRAEQEG